MEQVSDALFVEDGATVGFEHLRGAMRPEGTLQDLTDVLSGRGVGEDNGYGHPHQETLDRLEDAGAEIWRTDLDGDVLVILDGEELSVSTP